MRLLDTLNGLVKGVGLAGAVVGAVALGGCQAQPEVDAAAAEVALPPLAGASAVLIAPEFAGWRFDPSVRLEAEGDSVILTGNDGGWMRSERFYRDFEMEFDYQVESPATLGVAFRAPSAGDAAATGIEIGLVPRRGSSPAMAFLRGSALGWEAPAHEGEWNRLRLRVVGGSLDCWLNGAAVISVQRLDGPELDAEGLAIRDRLTVGCIAFQAIGGGARLRDVRLADLASDGDDGNWEWLIADDLAGWRKRGGGEWSVEDGALVGRNGPGHLFTMSNYQDFELRGSVKVNARGNGGIYFRTVPRQDDPDTWPLGFEAQVDQHDPKNFTGCIYDRAWPGDRTEPLTRDEAWFDYRIVARGDHIQTWINGQPMVDARLPDHQRGYFALQTHHPGNEIMFRDVRVKRLDAGR